MAETIEAALEAEAAAPRQGLCMCESYARVTEAAALAGARWLGRADQDAAEHDATQAMCDALGRLPIDGRIVIGSEDEESPLAIGRNVGGGGRSVDLALDPLEGRGVVARGGYGAEFLGGGGGEG